MLLLTPGIRRLRPSIAQINKVRLLSNINNKQSTKFLTIPNVLTLSRLAAAPLIGYSIINHTPKYALALMVGASITDFLDGFIARKFNCSSTFGSILDPTADKALMITLSVCLASSGTIPWWCGLSIYGRDLILALAALVVRYKTLPPPLTLARYFNMKIQSVLVKPNKLSKWNTFFQMVYLSTALANSVYPLISEPVMTYAAAVVTATTISSGVSYIFSKTAITKL